MTQVFRVELPQRVGIRVWLLCLLLSTVSHSHGESLEDLDAIVWTRQTRSFSDPDRLNAVLQVTPTVAVKNPQGSSPSALIKRLYGFGASDSQEAYAVIEDRILTLNGAQDATRLPTGKVLVPDLPKLTSRSSAVASFEGPVVLNRSTVVSAGASNSDDSPTFAYSKVVSIADPIEESLNYTRIDRYLAKDAQQVVRRAILTGVPILAGSESGIQLAGGASDCTDAITTVLSKDERDIIAHALDSSPAKIERYVVVLDTGWPTFEQQLVSLRILRRIFDAVRIGLRLPAGRLTRFEQELPATSFIPPTHMHACMISRSLREFVALDRNSRLKVLYLPLRPGQPVAREYFRELIELNQLIELKGDGLFSRSPTAQEIIIAKNFADQALANLRALKEPWSSEDDVVRLYEPLVSGLITVLDTYARIDPVSVPGQSKVEARFWISLSWNFTKYVAAPSLPSSPSYMVFAAAGNDKTDFVEGGRLFASEAAGSHRVFAVMNSDELSGGLTCNSAVFGKLWEEENAGANVASFPGRLSSESASSCPGPGGGTSFSTPRLAWLSAATDAALGEDGGDWSRKLGRRLLKSRLKVDADPNAAPVSVTRLFNTK